MLKVKHTQNFSDQYFNEHPHKYNLFGLSKMLSDYNIENAAFRIDNKENDIFAIKTPFIAHFGGDFVVVHKIKSDKISFLWKGISHALPVDEFVEIWTGIVLLAEPSEKSIEPDYKKHKKKERLNFLKKIAFFCTCGFIIFFIYIYQSLYKNAEISLLLLLNFSGIVICWLLLLKQTHVQSQYADKICSLLKQKDCNNVLESKASKLWGIFGWSEIGLAYFSSNIPLLLFLPQTVFLLAILNLLTLPYSFWSIWYQYNKAKQWCVLCLIVQILLWVIFIVNGLFGYIQMPVNGFQEIFYLFLLGSCYIASTLGINLMIPKFNTSKMTQNLRQALNSIKADEDVFKAILKQQPYYETNESDSMIHFGNPNSPLQLTVFSNPYCYPCSIMHKRIERLLEKTGHNISVKYILSSFDESLDWINKYLIAAYLENENNTTQIFTDWFEKGLVLRDNFFKDMHLNMDNPKIEIEFERHTLWRNKTQIQATPTILVHGYQMPENYKIEDLGYFTKSNSNI